MRSFNEHSFAKLWLKKITSLSFLWGHLAQYKINKGNQTTGQRKVWDFLKRIKFVSLDKKSQKSLLESPYTPSVRNLLFLLTEVISNWDISIKAVLLNFDSASAVLHYQLGQSYVIHICSDLGYFTRQILLLSSVSSYIFPTGSLWLQSQYDPHKDYKNSLRNYQEIPVKVEVNICLGAHSF